VQEENFEESLACADMVNHNRDYYGIAAMIKWATTNTGKQIKNSKGNT